MILRRIAYTEHGTFGVLMDNGVPFAVTLERPWLNNRRNVSCIPTGKYLCEKYSSKKHPKTYQVKDVADRTGILFHTGNIMDHSAGCILIGERFEALDGVPAILSSKDGFNEFIQRLKGNSKFELLVHDSVK